MTKKLYLDNPYLRKTNASVLDKKFKDEYFLVKLDRTIFFPNMAGGQPKDMGTIDGKKVIDVYEEGSDIIHVLEEDLKNKNVSLHLDWENRFDLMQQHTGQHILSATFENLFNIRTIGFHMGVKYISIDIEIPSLNKKDISQVEFLSNRIIQSNFKIKTEFISPDNLKDIDMEKVSQKIKNDDKIRIISIDNISTSPCCGTHVSSTGQIGLLKIINTEKYKGHTRISFICGNRALKDYIYKNETLKNIALSLSSGVDKVSERVLKLKEDKARQEKENKLLKEELISIKGDFLFDKKKTINNINYIVEYLAHIDKDELSDISSYLNKKEYLVQLYKLGDENKASFLVTISDDLDIDLKEIFDEISKKIIIKGGGNKRQIQGLTSPTIIDRVIEMIYKEIQSLFK